MKQYGQDFFGIWYRPREKDNVHYVRVLQDAEELEHWIDKKGAYSTHAELTDHILDALVRKEIPHGWS